MFNAIAPVAEHLNSHRKSYAGAAAIIGGAAYVNKRVKLWKEFFADPEAFNAKYPAE